MKSTILAGLIVITASLGANANPVMLKCTPDDDQGLFKNDLFYIEIDIESENDSRMTTHYFEILAIDPERPDREWEANWGSYEANTLVFEKEVVTTLMRGSFSEYRRIMDQIPESIDNGDHYIGEVADAMEAVGTSSIISVDILNRATLTYKKYLVSNLYGINELEVHNCEIYEKQNFLADKNDLQVSYQRVVDDHNSSLTKAEPEEGRGMPNQF